jgi:hypothetical protein
MSTLVMVGAANGRDFAKSQDRLVANEHTCDGHCGERSLREPQQRVLARQNDQVPTFTEVVLGITSKIGLKDTYTATGSIDVNKNESLNLLQ